MVSTSLDKQDAVMKKYKNGKSNLANLKKLGATILHGIDATKMILHTDLNMRKFDRIIFNFPHAGFHGKEDQLRLIRLHRKLVLGFFKNASRMLRPYGEIHVNHKTSGPFLDWNLEELASKCSLALIECVEFERNDYPGYNNKRGDGGRCDEPFHLGQCSTFKFRIRSTQKDKISAAAMGHIHDIPLQKIPEFQCENDVGNSQTNHVIHEQPEIQYVYSGLLRRDPPPYVSITMPDLMQRYDTSRTITIDNEFVWSFKNHVRHNHEMFGRARCEIYMQEEHERSWSGYIEHLQRQSILRSARRRRLLLGPN
ncbi:heavy metal-associated isoprenylated plant protein 41-like [Tasmannia lanceolata]|uniref:heavy metal-associated isoprenylated plant protein 41-like n=1 Tax=Tasmannia lanceolata TaxID=3420 RepID=UPI004063F6C2